MKSEMHSGKKRTFLLSMIPFLAVVLLAFVLLGSLDALMTLVWWGCLLILGMAVLPLSLRLFSSFRDRGYLFGKTLGLAGCGYLVWFLSSMKVLPFRIWTIWGSILLIAALFYFVNRGWKLVGDTLFSTDNKIYPAILLQQETMLLAGIVAWAFLRGIKPELAGGGQEKFMDYGFMNTILRTDFMPPLDIWFAGKPINYYYFGHYLSAWLTRMSGVPSSVGYNLMMATLFSFAFSLTFSLVSSIAGGIGKFNPKHAIAAGFISATLLTFGGNLHPFVYTFIMQTNKEVLIEQTPNLEIRDQYWFPDATRFIGHNPKADPPNEDMTIHEFPIYSFVISDLHAHVINLPFVLTLLAVLVGVLDKMIKREGQERKRFWPNILLIAFLIGLFQMTNYWDFPIYSIVACGVLFLSYMIQAESFSFIPVNSVFGKGLLLLTVGVGIVCIFMKYPLYLVLCSMGITWVVIQLLAAGMRVLPRLVLHGGSIFVVSLLFALPFSSNLTSLINGIKLVPHHSAFWQLFVVWGQFFVLLILFAILVFAVENRLSVKPETMKLNRYGKKTPVKHMPLKEASNYSKYLNRVFHDRPADGFVLLLLLCAVGLLLLPEIIYIKDIYEGGYVRSNTMFKLTYQAFIIFTISSGYIVVRVFQVKCNTMLVGWMRALIVIVLTMMMMYPFYAIGSWYGKPAKSLYKGLDGSIYLKTQMPDDYAAATWLKQNVSGQPTVLEANGESYTDYGRISVETGFPTIQGWWTHEWLWRNSHDTVAERVAHVHDIYTSTDMAQTNALLKKYNVHYIVLGELERTKFPDLQEEKLMQLGSVVFEQGSITIIEVFDTVFGMSESVKDS